MKKSKMKEKSAAYFDRIAQRNHVIEEPVKCYQAVLDRLAVFQFKVLGDIGCGTGEMLSGIEAVYGDNVKLYGIDLSEKSIEKAKNKCSAEISLGDAENMHYENDFFDVLICMHSIHHYPEPVKALNEMNRILKPGGTLILVDNDLKAARRIRANLSFAIFRHREGDIRFYTGKQLTAMACKAGFNVDLCEHIADHSQLLMCSKKTARESS